MTLIYTVVFILASTAHVVAYSPAVHSRDVLPMLKEWSSGSTNPFNNEGLDIELPDFHKMFEKIQQASPLARSVINGWNDLRGFAALDDKRSSDVLKWKTIEAKQGKTVHEIRKVDNFGGISSAPMLRFRSSLKGPCVGEYFGRYIMDLEQRKKWDDQIADVKEIHTVEDMDSANIAMGFGAYGDCSRLGVGYGQTKPAFGVTPREQMFLYGLQEFADGSCLIWGSELDEKYDYLLPPGQRHTRAKSHLFSATLVPTSENSFDVEYALQMEIGGNIPSFLTTSPIITTVKSLFATAAREFGKGIGGPVEQFLQSKKQNDNFASKVSLLMTP
jgi:hypothetical protein